MRKMDVGLGFIMEWCVYRWHLGIIFNSYINVCILEMAKKEKKNVIHFQLLFSLSSFFSFPKFWTISSLIWSTTISPPKSISLSNSLSLSQFLFSSPFPPSLSGSWWQKGHADAARGATARRLVAQQHDGAQGDARRRWAGQSERRRAAQTWGRSKVSGVVFMV